MKALKKDLKSLLKSLKSLTKQTERMVKKLDKLAKAQTPEKKRAKARVKAKPAKPAKKRVVARKAAVSKKAKVPAIDTVYKIIRRRSKGVDMATLTEKTDFKDKKIRDIIYRLKKQGKIKSARAGLYVKL